MRSPGTRFRQTLELATQHELSAGQQTKMASHSLLKSLCHRVTAADTHGCLQHTVAMDLPACQERLFRHQVSKEEASQYRRHLPHARLRGQAPMPELRGGGAWFSRRQI